MKDKTIASSAAITSNKCRASEFILNPKFPFQPWQAFRRTMLVLACLCLSVTGYAATFSGTASISANDPLNALSADSVNNALTVSCWFRISIPSSTNLTENMVLLMDRTDGNESANFSYQIRFNIYTGNIEFLARGSGGGITNTLIVRPYLDRWYHVAVVRAQSAFTAYVDGRQLASFPSLNIGNAVGGGLSIGGISGNLRLFLGDIVEVAIYQFAMPQNLIQDRMFKDQRTFPNLKGYYKLAYSTNAADYRNYVTTPPSGTDPATKQGSGTIGFEETDQAGEQSIFDSRKNRGQDAISPLSGAFSWTQPMLARAVPGIAFDFRIGYSSATPTMAPADGSVDPYERRVLGPSWRHTFDTRIITEQISTERRLLLWDGSIETWNRTNSSYYTRHREYRGELVLTNFDFEWTTPERIVYHFQDPTDGMLMAGRLREIRDFNGNRVQLQWNEDEGYITNVVDTANGSYRFNYNTVLGLLTNVTFGQWQANFTYDPTNRLVAKTITNTSSLYAAIGTTWQFQYNSNGLLARIIDPRGNTNTFVQYDQYGRQTNQVDALSRATATRYGVPGNRQITRIDSETNQWIETYDRKGHLLAQQDPLTNTTSYTYEDHGNRASAVEPLGWTSYFGYDDRANVIAKTNALNEVTRWVIHPFFNKAVQQTTPQPTDANGWTTWTNFYQYDDAGNLTNHYDAFGSLVSYTYYTNGLVHTSTDANGHTTTSTYDTNGFLYTQTDPATNTTTFFRNDVGWKQRELNALSEQTSYGYDLNGNVTRILDALTRVFYRSYDENGNLLSATDAKSKATTYGYDAANQRTNMVDRTGTNIWQYFYTLRGKLEHATDPLTHSVTNVYDAANRLFRISDPLGHWVTNQYDANGNLIFFFDKLGKRWSKTYDRLDRLQTEADPIGNTRQTIYDVADRIYEIISPNTYPSFHTYDGRGRLITWLDPQNYSWRYDYDGVGNITNITDALLGHYIMGYGSRNERKMEQNQDTNIWQYTYDELLRLKQQTDPNQVVRKATYDAGGRLRVVDFSTGRQDTFDYDDNDNLRLLTRRPSSGLTTSLQLIPDMLDRIQEEDDANNQTVLYGHDPLGRVTVITYPGNFVLNNFYDALGRLTNQVDRAGRQMSYTYDLADRLQTRRYPNGVVQTNGFDDAGRLTGLSYASPNISTSNSIQIALSYAYDSNGNKSGGGESRTFNWPLPSLTDDNSQFTAAGRLKSRQIQNNSAISNQLSQITYNYDANGNMTNASGNGQAWTLAYDEDNRTTSIQWDAGITSKNIKNRYDAFGRRISKTTDGVTTGYVLDLSGGMERVLCDLDGNGNVTAWYVHGPDLCYRVDSTNGLLCYHADAQANIIALTDGNTNLVAQYAYTPYGRSLGSTNFQSHISNPYLFVGSQGVQEESDIPNLYFMRARYYSADAGVFLSTDPVKKIGPGWKPTAYAYANENPLAHIDPTGNDIALEAGKFGEAFVLGVLTRAVWTTGSILSYAINRTRGYSADESLQAADSVFGFLGEITSNDSWGDKAADYVWTGLEQQALSHPIQPVKPLANNPITSITSGMTVQSLGQNPFLQQVKNAVGGNAPLINMPGISIGGQTAKPASQMVNGAVVANGQATGLNQRQATPTAQPSGSSQTSSSSSGSSNARSSSGNATSTQTTTQSPANSGTSFLGQVGSVISNVATSIGNFFSSIFRR